MRDDGLLQCASDDDTSDFDECCSDGMGWMPCTAGSGSHFVLHLLLSYWGLGAMGNELHTLQSLLLRYTMLFQTCISHGDVMHE